MSCFLRHINDILKEAGIVITQENNKRVDQAIHNLVEGE